MGEPRIDKAVLLAGLDDPERQRRLAEAGAAYERRAWLLSLTKKPPEELERLAEELEQRAKAVRAAAARARRRRGG
jgi:hypothetical protein